MSRIILLNGVGSAGKSSLARALQGITTLPFLHVSMDNFLDMLPAAWGPSLALAANPLLSLIGLATGALLHAPLSAAPHRPR